MDEISKKYAFGLRSAALGQANRSQWLEKIPPDAATTLISSAVYVVHVEMPLLAFGAVVVAALVLLCLVLLMVPWGSYWCMRKGDGEREEEIYQLRLINVFFKQDLTSY